jgi:aminoglycoside phosphotransferase family enzyme/predicted kinase
MSYEKKVAKMDERDTIEKPPPVVRALLKPETYPHATRGIELVQTQMSFLFLTGDYVYKVKKPVNLGFLDYTTLEKRLFFCQQEIELNRRLSPDTYLDVVSIVSDNGELKLGDKGEVVEYAVKMKQLPGERMMDVLLPQDKVTGEMVSQVARKLADFHLKAETDSRIGEFGKPESVAVNTDENFSQTEKYISVTISPHIYRRIKAYTDTFLKNENGLFNSRVSAGRIKDCHGDLHAAHICFNNGITIYDCIEFNDRFRYCDVASEIAFLAMDLDRYDHPGLSKTFSDAYIEFSGDSEIERLLDFYKCYRAYVRGKVESFKLDDLYITDKDRALNMARTYFNLAYRYTRKRPLLIIVSGLMGTGKTTLAQALGSDIGLKVISSDVTRKELAGIAPQERRFEKFDSGIYSDEFSRQTYDTMLTRARSLLASGESVLLDASFKKRQDRLSARNLADEVKADFLIVECTLDEQSIKERLEQRVREGSVSDGRWEIFGSQKEDFEPIDEVTGRNHVIVNTSEPLSDIETAIWERIG